MFTININTATIEARLADLQALLDDLTPVMNKIGQALVFSTEERFKTGTGPDGTAWAARSPVTLAEYKRRGIRFGPTPLTQSGELSNSIFHDYDAASVRVGSNVIQSAVMQFGAGQGAFGATARGGSIPWGDIPARPYLGLSEEDRTDILDICSEALADAAGG